MAEELSEEVERVDELLPDDIDFQLEAIESKDAVEFHVWR